MLGELEVFTGRLAGVTRGVFIKYLKFQNKIELFQNNAIKCFSLSLCIIVLLICLAVIAVASKGVTCTDDKLFIPLVMSL